MAFDFKKEYKEFYMPKNKPEIVNVPKANYIAVRGKGDPNEEGGAYQQAISVLYAVAYTLKMSYKTDHKIEGFFEYVVPPLEGFWWQDDVESVDYTNKSAFNWISVIRLPDFISKADFDWAVETATKKKKLDCSSAEYLTIDEGLCVQIMHMGPFENEPATVALMDTCLEQNGYDNRPEALLAAMGTAPAEVVVCDTVAGGIPDFYLPQEKRPFQPPFLAHSWHGCAPFCRFRWCGGIGGNSVSSRYHFRVFSAL